MKIEATNYPLEWPIGWRRTAGSRRKRAKFRGHDGKNLGIALAVQRLLDELQRMGVAHDDAIVSTNVRPTLAGVPHGGAAEPYDPGAAVYWIERSKPGHPSRSMAIDTYDRVADNINALTITLGYMRGIERHGGAEILDRAFAGFAALPPPVAHWSVVLNVPPTSTLATVKRAYEVARAKAHPDKGGTAEDFDAVTKAWEQAQLELPE